MNEIYEQARNLPAGERRALPERLLDALPERPDGDVERAWNAEAARRLESIRAGRTEPLSWTEARAALFAR